MDINKLIAEIFQFPPPRGGEPHNWFYPSWPCNFNSRPREGANIRAWDNLRPDEISIPAPARGRTMVERYNCPL